MQITVQFPPAFQIAVANGITVLPNGAGHSGKGGGNVSPVISFIRCVGCPGMKIIGSSTDQSGQGFRKVLFSGALVMVMLESQLEAVVPPSLSPQ